jgi:transcriptional regulator with XRE-family HTH domain
MEASEIRGNRIKALRMAIGMESTVLARRAKVSRDALHRIENHLAREPLLATMRRIATALELGRFSDLYVIDGDGGLTAALARRTGADSAQEPGRAARHPGAGTQEVGALVEVFDRWSAATAHLPEDERQMLAELGDDTGSGMRAALRALRAWCIAHDGAGAVTIGRLRKLARVWVIATADDPGEALERLDAALTALRGEWEPDERRARLSLARGRGRG